MPTSGSYTLNYTVNDLIQEAFELIMVVGNGQSLSGSRYNRGLKTLNLLLKHLENKGLHLWQQETGYLFLNKGDYEYPFATANLANAYGQTTLDADEAISQTILSVAATSVTLPDGTTKTMTAADIIGIVTDDDNMHWTTVASISAGDTVTVDDALTVAASSGSEVFWYTPSSFVPCRKVVQDGIRRKDANGYEIPIMHVSRETYKNQPNKATTGIPVTGYFDRQLGNGTMFLWPAPSDSAVVIPFDYERKSEVSTASTETLDVPEEYQEMLVYNLATRLPFKYACPPGRWAEIQKHAAMTMADVLGDDQETAAVTVRIARH